MQSPQANMPSPGSPVRSLLPQTVELTLAFLAASEVDSSDLPSLVRDIHGALLDVAHPDAGRPADPRPAAASRPAQVSAPAPAAAPSSAAPVARPSAAAPTSAPAAGPSSAKGAAATLPDPLPAPPARRAEPKPRRPRKTPSAARAAPSEAAAPARTAPLGSEALPPEAAPAPAPGKKARRAAAAGKAARRARSAPAPAATPAAASLPKGLSSPLESARTDLIICLEDGRRMKDIRTHLAKKGMYPDEYRAKWGLPPEFPLQSYAHVIRDGATFEWDMATDTFKRV